MQQVEGAFEMINNNYLKIWVPPCFLHTRNGGFLQDGDGPYRHPRLFKKLFHLYMILIQP